MDSLTPPQKKRKKTTATENTKYELLLNINTRKYYEIEEMMKLAKKYREVKKMHLTQ